MNRAYFRRSDDHERFDLRASLTHLLSCPLNRRFLGRGRILGCESELWSGT